MLLCIHCIVSKHIYKKFKIINYHNKSPTYYSYVYNLSVSWVIQFSSCYLLFSPSLKVFPPVSMMSVQYLWRTKSLHKLSGFFILYHVPTQNWAGDLCIALRSVTCYYSYNSLHTSGKDNFNWHELFLGKNGIVFFFRNLL